MNIEMAAYNGFCWFIGTAVFVVCWMLFAVIGGTILKLLAGSEDGEDE